MQAIITYTDAELVTALQRGSSITPAVKFLYHAYFDFLSIYIKQHNGTTEDAEDIFQEVIVAFIELVQQQKFRGESSVKTFLYALNRNIWLNELKSRERAGKRERLIAATTPEMDTDVSHVIEGLESRKAIMTIVSGLGEVCKKILLAFYYDNLPIKEILEKLDYENEQVVRNKKYKCLKQLEQMLTSNPSVAKTLKTALQYEQ